MLENLVSYLVSSHNFVNIATNLPDEIPLNYVRVKFLYCGICGGDYSRFLGYRTEYPISLGHEFVAEVLDYNCNTNLDYSIGDFVVSDFNYRCMECEYCIQNKTHLCKQNDISLFTNRAFALYADIHNSYLVRTNISHNHIYRATCIEPLSCILHAMEHYDMSQINSILIYGIGNIGMLCAFYLSCCMKKDVHIHDINDAKQSNTSELFSCKKAQFDVPYDLIIEATNSPKGLLECIHHSTYNQRICSFSHLYGQDTTGIYDELVKKESIAYFPLRNGSKNNLQLADKYICNNWNSDYDSLLQIYETNDINAPFYEKRICSHPKQIIQFRAG